MHMSVRQITSAFTLLWSFMWDGFWLCTMYTPLGFASSHQFSIPPPPPPNSHLQMPAGHVGFIMMPRLSLVLLCSPGRAQAGTKKPYSSHLPLPLHQLWRRQRCSFQKLEDPFSLLRTSIQVKRLALEVSFTGTQVAPLAPLVWLRTLALQFLR